MKIDHSKLYRDLQEGSGFVPMHKTLLTHRPAPRSVLWMRLSLAIVLVCTLLVVLRLLLH